MNDVQSVQQLFDKEAIKDLRHRFGHAVDGRDWPVMNELFANRLEVDFSQYGIPPGPMERDAFVALFKHSFRDAAVRTQQLYSGFLVTVEGDRASSRSYLYGHHHKPDAPGGGTWEIRAEYQDELVRTAEGWRIAGVKLNVISIVGNPALVS